MFNMISATFNDASFNKLMNNIVEYSVGFTDGVQKGKVNLMNSVADEAISILQEYLDSSAKVDPASLAHVYEWDGVGRKIDRLFELEKQVTSSKITISSNFLRSQSIKNGSKEPFYEKAAIMENGIPVTIKPKESNVLVFDANGETVFTSKEVRVANPGGDQAVGGFERAFNSFFNSFVSQSLLTSGNFAMFIKNPKDYATNLKAGSVGGKMVGISTGYNWISRAGGMIN